MKKEQIEQIIDFLKNNTAISNIFWEHIYFNIPVITPKEAFLCFEVVSNREYDCFYKDLLLFSIASKEAGTTALEVKWFLDTLEETLWTFNMIFGTFETFRSNIWESERIYLSDKTRWIAEKNFTFSYAK